jgi:hypothetical protein
MAMVTIQLYDADGTEHTVQVPGSGTTAMTDWSPEPTLVSYKGKLYQQGETGYGSGFPYAEVSQPYVIPE